MEYVFPLSIFFMTTVGIIFSVTHMKDVVFLLDIRREFFKENEGICHIGEDVYVEKIYIEPKPKSVNDSVLKIFKEVKSFDEKK